MIKLMSTEVKLVTQCISQQISVTWSFGLIFTDKLEKSRTGSSPLKANALLVEYKVDHKYMCSV